MINSFKKVVGIIVVGSLISGGIYLCVHNHDVKASENIDKDVKIEKSNEEILVASLENNTSKTSDSNNKSFVNEEINKLEEILNNQLLILVNKDNKLSEDYMPTNLKLSDIKFLDYIETRDLEEVTGNAAKEMFDAALQEGITLLGASGYRSYNIQMNLYNTRVAKIGKDKASLYTAEPGASEHQTGLAIDILGKDYQYLDDGFENSESFNWLINNCYKYGFILRYVKGKESITGYNYEPWHFRYIGNEEIAKDIMDRGIVFEEYIDELNNKIQELKGQL